MNRYVLTALAAVLLVFIMASVAIQSGATNDYLTVDPTSKAARVTLYSTTGTSAIVDTTSQAQRVSNYDARGNLVAQKPTYSAATTARTATAAGTGPWFTICGSATKTVRVQRFAVSGTSATAVHFGDVELIKTSTATSSGTAVTLNKVPHDSGSAASTANLVNFYSTLATPGSAVGAIASRVIFIPLSTSPVMMSAPTEIDFRNHNEAEGVVLRGIAQCLEASFGTTTTDAPTLSVEVMWTEE